MNLDEIAPLKLYINLAKREERRKLSRGEFAKHHLHVERMPAVPKALAQSSRGLGNVGRYACGLSKRLAIRKAKHLGAPAVAIFEDDVIFHHDFQALLAQITLPDDWQILYLGCVHRAPFIPVSDGLVRAVKAYDNHAVVIRDTAYDQVLHRLRPLGKNAQPRSVVASDVALAELNAEMPCYAAFPNLVWQRPGNSDNQHGWVNEYNPDGSQRPLQ
jgi:hypothetical protein